MQREIRITKDGSHSIYLKEMDEQYHSIHGSIAEAMTVYINYGLEEKAKQQSSISVFEMGFGSGLNALLTLDFASRNDLEVKYYGLEKYPIPEDEVELLNYADQHGIKEEVFKKIHSLAWEELLPLNDHFHLKKIKADLRELELPKEMDVIYFDAFAPEKQSHLWTEDIFQKLYDCLKIDGILTTYSVKGEVRRKLKSVGFTVEKLAGPEGGKREVLRARKK